MIMLLINIIIVIIINIFILVDPTSYVICYMTVIHVINTPSILYTVSVHCFHK
ncbi:hypothetical protein BJ944DRAFT_273041 [Cunninghamella echinulata]|nr:hypothetical protein BJ944DRAFT_273041 [Cunninghamella echinulata]